MIVQISEAVRLLLILWIGVLCIKILLRLFKCRKMIEIAKIEKAFKNTVLRKRFFTWCVMLFFIIYAVMHCTKARMIPQLRVALTFEEADKGQTPNKTRFNESWILSPTVMEGVIQKGNLNLTVEELTACFALNNFFDDRKINEETPESALKIATEYRVVFTDNIYRYQTSPRDIMEWLADVYEEEFQRAYVKNDSILTLELEVIEDMEYLDVTDYLRLQAEKLCRYLDNCAGENSALSVKIKTYMEVELERYRSYVLENGLSKRNDEYGMRIDHLNRMLQMQYDKDVAAYEVRMEMMNLYNTRMTDYVLVPTVDPNGGFYMSRTKVGVDYFADEADKFSQSAKERKEEMENNEYIRQRLNFFSESSAFEHAEEQIAKLTEELADLSAECREYCDLTFQNKQNSFGDGYLQLDVIEVSSQSLITTSFRGTFIFAFVLYVYLVVSELEKIRLAERLKMQCREAESDE